MANFDGLQLGATPVAWTPVVSATTGSGIVVTINSAVATRWSRWCFYALDFTVTNAGTGSGFMTVTLPIAASALAVSMTVGRESGVDGRMLQGYLAGNNLLYICYASDLTYPGQVGKRPILSGMYDI
jgi:hypothetical protein